MMISLFGQCVIVCFNEMSTVSPSFFFFFNVVLDGNEPINAWQAVIFENEKYEETHCITTQQSITTFFFVWLLMKNLQIVERKKENKCLFFYLTLRFTEVAID